MSGKSMVFVPRFYLPLDHVPRKVMGISCGISMLVYQLLGAYCVSNQADGASIHKKREVGLMTGVLMKTWIHWSLRTHLVMPTSRSQGGDVVPSPSIVILMISHVSLWLRPQVWSIWRYDEDMFEHDDHDDWLWHVVKLNVDYWCKPNACERANVRMIRWYLIWRFQGWFPKSWGTPSSKSLDQTWMKGFWSTAEMEKEQWLPLSPWGPPRL